MTSELPIKDAKTYIGDGVYISFDGFQLWLTAGDNNIAMEPAVYQNLLSWVQSYPRLSHHLHGQRQ